MSDLALYTGGDTPTGSLILTKDMVTETAHRLTDYVGRCSKIHGHSWSFSVSIEGSVDLLQQTGLLLDYKFLKEYMMEVLDPLDHSLLLSRDDLLVERFGVEGVKDLFIGSDGSEARLHLCGFNPTSENLSIWATQQISALVKKDGFDGFKVKVVCKETKNSSCEYTPHCG